MVELKKQQLKDSNKTDDGGETADEAAMNATKVDDDMFAKLEELEENGSVRAE